MRRILVFVLIIVLVGILYELLNPTKPDRYSPDLDPEPVINYWEQFQTDTVRAISPGYWFDDPTEAWHEADHNDDSDDPELYNDKYDGK